MEMFSGNHVKNPSAETGTTEHWEEINNVSIVPGGFEGSYCFRFEPTASMKQTVPIPGTPNEVRFEFYFLPGKDIQSASAVKGQVIMEAIYGDGLRIPFIIPGKSYLEGYWV